MLGDPAFIKSQNGRVVLSGDVSAKYDVRDINGGMLFVVHFIDCVSV